jgi:UDP-glucose 4-epimerase
MKILITGVAGLLGARMADWLIENNPESTVIGIDDLSGGYLENINKDVKFYNLNLVSDSLDDIFNIWKPDYVYHFAAYAAEGLSPFIRMYNYQNNLVATANIINQCIKHDVKRLIFTSTLAVYGHGDGGIFDEKQVPNPIDPYGVAKYGCEMDIKIAGEQHGLDWCIIRPHNVYGIKQNIWDKYRNVLGIWMYQHLNNQPMSIFGDGKQTRAFSYIDDILEPLWKAATKKEASKEIINLGGIEEYSIIESAELLQEIIGSGELLFLEERHEVKHSIPTWKKSEEILDFKHTTSLKDGLTKMWDWAKQQPNRERFVWKNYEVDNKIYSFWKN